MNLRAIPSRIGLAAVLVAAGLLARALLRPEKTDPPPGVLPRENTAYAAVAADDKANAGLPPQALALPLKSGSSPDVRGPEEAAMPSRVRLLNVRLNGRKLFSEYGSLNQGIAADEQLDGLLALGVRHLLVHANFFDEEVSPFPAAATLRALTDHPRLSLIADDGQTFAFRILPKHPVEHVPPANWSDLLFATLQHWSWDPPLEIPQGEAVPLLLCAPVQPAPGLRYLLRIAEGSAQPLLTPPTREGISSLTHPIAGYPDWLQADLPGSTGAFVTAISGPVILEYALLTAGELPEPGPDGTLRVPPALLFHSGHSSPGDNSVAFRPDTVPAGLALQGPNLPFPPGTYDILITYATDLPAGTLRLLTLPDRAELAAANLRGGGEPILFRAIPVGSAPLRFELDYNGQAHLTLHGIWFRPATLQLRPVAAPS